MTHVNVIVDGRVVAASDDPVFVRLVTAAIGRRASHEVERVTADLLRRADPARRRVCNEGRGNG